ncbi:MAG TPA: hypothetical protein VI110_03295 [Lapillicoccus sp.]
MRRLTIGAAVAAAALTLAGCSSGSPSPATTTPPTSAATSSTSSTSAASSSTSTSGTPTVLPGRTITITVKGSTVTPPPAQVDLPVGEMLTVVVTSDHDDELHAHGFEVEVPLKAGVPTTITLTGKDPGVFEVELHEPALTLLTVAVR